MSQDSAPVLTAFSTRVLKKLASGGRARAVAEGGIRVGSLSVPPSVVAALTAADLIRSDKTGIHVTDAGAAHVRRAELAKAAPGRGSSAGAATSQVDAYRGQHAQMAAQTREIDGVRRSVRVNLAESPLGWFVSRKGRDGKPLISVAQFEAGERLRSDFELAGLNPRLVRSYDGAPIGGRRGVTVGADPTDVQLDARTRFHRALEAVGPDLSDVLVRICCFLEGLEEAERKLGWPARSGKVVLRIALDRLHDHYQGRRG